MYLWPPQPSYSLFFSGALDSAITFIRGMVAPGPVNCGGTIRNERDRDQEPPSGLAFLERAEQLGDPRNGEDKLRTKTCSDRSLQHDIQQPSAECSVLCWLYVEYSPIGCGAGYPLRIQAQGFVASFH